MIDLFEEFAAAVAMATRRDFDLLTASGASRRFLTHGACRYGVSAIVPERDGGYQPTESGELAYIIPAIPLAAPWDRDFPSEDVGDLIAWRMSCPSRWWWRSGTVAILNPRAIDRAEIMRESLAVYSSPLAWMQAGGAGCVVLDPRADLRLHFGGVSHVSADTVELGVAIERRLRTPRPPLPRIFVKRAA